MFIGLVTLAGRRWGSTISGLLIGLPLTSGPISLFLAFEYGRGFAAQAAVGSLVGQGSFCLFCLTYSRLARTWPWFVSALGGVVVFVVLTVVWTSIAWSLLSASMFLLGVIALGAWGIPYTKPCSIAPLRLPHWDLLARMVLAAVFVLVLTTCAAFVGPHLSGLLSPFPTTGLVLAVFTHHHQGRARVITLLRGNIIGSLAFAGFFLVVGLCVLQIGLVATYLCATLVAVSISGLALYLSRYGGS